MTEISESHLCECRGYLFSLLEDVQLIIQTTQNQTSSEWASANTVLIPQRTELTFSQTDYVKWPCSRPLDYLSLTALTCVFLPPHYCSLSSSVLDAAAAVGAWREEAPHTVQCRHGQKSREWSRMSGGECVSWGAAESRRNIKDKLFQRTTLFGWVCFTCSFAPTMWAPEINTPEINTQSVSWPENQVYRA